MVEVGGREGWWVLLNKPGGLFIVWDLARGQVKLVNNLIHPNILAASHTTLDAHTRCARGDCNCAQK